MEENIRFYDREKARLDQLLKELGWTEDGLFSEVRPHHRLVSIE